MLDSNFIMVAVNEARLRTTNTQRGNIIGQSLFDVFPDNPDDPTAAGVRNLTASLQRVLATCAPDAIPVQKYDIRRTQEQIHGFEERYWSPVNWPVLNSDGTVAYIVHQVVDVTDFVVERKPIADSYDAEAMSKRIQELEVEMFTRSHERLEATEKLRESQERYRALVVASSQVLYRMSPDWSEMRQLHGGDFIADTDKPNRNWMQDYIHPDDQPRSNRGDHRVGPQPEARSDWRRHRSEQVLHYLKEHGCNQAQGYWFSQPLPASQFAQWYQRHHLH